MGPSLRCEVAPWRAAPSWEPIGQSRIYLEGGSYTARLSCSTEAREKRNEVEELVPSTPSSCTYKLSRQILFPSIEYGSEHVRLKYVVNVTWLQLSTNHVLRYKNHISWLSSKHIPRPTSLFTWIFHDVKMARFYAEINIFKGACLTYDMSILVVINWRYIKHKLLPTHHELKCARICAIA